MPTQCSCCGSTEFDNDETTFKLGAVSDIRSLPPQAFLMRICKKCGQVTLWRKKTIGDRLRKQLKRVGSQRVPQATVSDLDGFQAEPSKCHENVDRWCQQHPGDKPARGWLVTGEYMFDKHSVVDLGGQNRLLDITLQNGAPSNFLIHNGSEEEFFKLPNQVPAI